MIFKVFAASVVLSTISIITTQAESMCAPGEPSDVCAMIETRNNALDQYARAEGARRDEVSARIKEHEYWKEYVKGLPDIPKLTKHMHSVCGWRGVQTKPVAELCSWWRVSKQ